MLLRELGTNKTTIWEIDTEICHQVQISLHHQAMACTVDSLMDFLIKIITTSLLLIMVVISLWEVQEDRRWALTVSLEIR